jgi:hypothetical protein
VPASPAVGGQLTPQEQQYWDAAADLSPDKSLNRIDDLARFVFANVAVVGTILAGFGLFTGAAQTLQRGPSLLGLPLTIAFVAGSLVLAIGALFPSLSGVNPGELDTVKGFFRREIPRRGICAMLALTLFACAVISAAAVAVTDAAPQQRAPAISLQLTGTGPGVKLAMHSQVAGLPQGSLMTTSAVARRGRKSRALCQGVSRVDASGAATIDCQTAAGSFRVYTVTTRVTQAGRTLQSNTVSVTR